FYCLKVQWKPNWSKQIHTPSALKDFYGRATVLGCVVKNDVLRSRVRRRIEWNRREFMSCNFRIRVEHPDGSVTSEVLPYPDVKRRFPAALFEYMENRMPPPRVPEKDEPRPDGLLAVYNNINIPHCLYLNKSMTKKVQKAEEQTILDVQNSPTENVENLSVAKQEPHSPRSKNHLIHGMNSKSVPLKEVNVRVKGGKKRRSHRRFGTRSRLLRSRSATANDNAEESPSVTGRHPSNETSTAVSKANGVQVKIIRPPGISLACAQEFLRKVHSGHTYEFALSQKSTRLSGTSTKRLNGKRQPTSSPDEDIVVIQEIISKPNKSSLSSPDSRSTPKSSLSTRSSGKRSPGVKENHKGSNEVKILLNSDSRSHKTTSVKRARRSSSNEKSLSCKRSTPLRPRNSLDNYFKSCGRRSREVLGNATNQQNISARC
ncbi:hypothetical protein GCK32_014802, partial [Trichostrongylus colubriformis]